MSGEDFDLQKIFTIAQIASQLIAASMSSGHQIAASMSYDHGDGSLTPSAATKLAELIFMAADVRVAGATPEAPHAFSRPERMRFIRLNEKLRAGTLDSEERVEFADILDRSF